MLYIWIFAGSYTLVFCGVFYFMYEKASHAANRLRHNGIGEEEIDPFYKSMIGISLVTLLWSTFFTGSIIGAIISAIYWLAT